MQVKRILSIAVLALILVQGLVALLVWQVQVQILHQQNWNNQVSATTFEMRLTKEEYQKAKINSHEIRINQRMYDIKSLVINASEVSLMLEADEEESYIHQKIIIGMTNKGISK